MDERTSFVKSQAMDGRGGLPNPSGESRKQAIDCAAVMDDRTQSVYSKTCTTLFTPPTLRTWFTTASASLWLTSPIR